MDPGSPFSTRYRRKTTDAGEGQDASRAFQIAGFDLALLVTVLRVLASVTAVGVVLLVA